MKTGKLFQKLFRFTETSLNDILTVIATNEILKKNNTRLKQKFLKHHIPTIIFENNLLFKISVEVEFQQKHILYHLCFINFINFVKFKLSIYLYL